MPCGIASKATQDSGDPKGSGFSLRADKVYGRITRGGPLRCFNMRTSPARPSPVNRNMKLSIEDIALLLESLSYSIQRVSDAPGTPDEYRQEKLQCLRVVQEKLRRMKTSPSEWSHSRTVIRCNSGEKDGPTSPRRA